uniref:Putative laccase 3 n=1 Tax=Flammulina velutipes TaxID=38945 RepID=V9XS35_FLAVE|nr:putative laccase 3 [Flammulina velutipes]
MAAYDALRGKDPNSPIGARHRYGDVSEELARRRRAYERQQSYNRGAKSPQYEWDSNPEERWKANMMIAFGILALVAGIAPSIFILPYRMHKNHTNAVRNYSNAREEALEDANARRQGRKLHNHGSGDTVLDLQVRAGSTLSDSCFALSLSARLAFAAIGPVTDLRIQNAHLGLDGYDRSGVFADGMFPGPLIIGNKGDDFKINVINELTDEAMLKTTSIHWHGLLQKGTNWADGPSFINQCPIAPGNSFSYDFSAADQAGTFWYHSHLSTQYCDGLRGPFVVYDPEDPHEHRYDVDDESTVITLSDWYHKLAPQQGAVPLPQSTLINGRGRFPQGPLNDLAVVNVVQGTRYRFRLIAMSCAPNWVFSIDNHLLEVIEADGINTQPLLVDSIQIFAGQRYSFVLTADQAVDNYWIRADPNEGNQGFEGGINSAVLRYSGAPETEPSYDVTKEVILFNPLVETNLHPLVTETEGVAGGHFNDGADVNINLAFAIDPKLGRFTVNGATYRAPTMPVLLQIMSGASSAQNLLPSSSIYELPLNKSIQLSFPGGAPGSPHPFHLHGHAFDVIRSAGSDQYNYNDPVRRDVVSTGDVGDNVTIRFVTDNAGPWFLHCHVDWHMEAGLAVIFTEGTNREGALANPTPDSWDDLCPAYNALSPTDLGGILPDTLPTAS